MKRTIAVLGAAWVPFLSGCMMMGGLGRGGGSGHMSGTSHSVGSGHAGDPRLVEADDVESGLVHAPLQLAEASSGGLSIGLSFETPRKDGVVAISARLRADGHRDGLTDGDVRLRIQTPSGSVDSLRMQPTHSSRGMTYRTYYRFPLGGQYVVTAEGRTGVAGDSRTVSVTARVDVGSGMDGSHRPGWYRPSSVVPGWWH